MRTGLSRHGVQLVMKAFTLMAHVSSAVAQRDCVLMDHVMSTTASPRAPGLLAPSPRGATDARLRQATAEFEAVFLAEMLSAMGLGRQPKAFGGGFGSEAFQSFLHEAYAENLVRRGGVGIADALYRQAQGAWRDD